MNAAGKLILKSPMQLIILTLREKYPNTELFLVHIFPHSDWMRRDTKYRSVFGPNAAKYRPKITPCLDTFRAVSVYQNELQTDINLEKAHYTLLLLVWVFRK